MEQNLRRAPTGQWEFFTNFYADHHDLAFETDTPLILASRRGDLDAVRSLIAGRSEMIGNTAVHEAVRCGHYGVTKFLLEESPNCGGESLLYLAAEKGNAAIVELILRVCESPSYDGPRHKTALHAAALANSAECVRLLLDALHPSAANKVDNIGWTALHHAAKFGYVKLVKLFLSKHSSLAYIPGQDGASETALHTAVANGHLNVLREFLIHCPDGWESVTSRSKNVLHLAVENEHEGIVEFILDQFWAGELINKKDDKGNTPLHTYVGTKGLDGCSLLKHPCLDRNAFNHDDMTPLDLVHATGKVTERQNFIEDQLLKEGAILGIHNATKKLDILPYKSVSINSGVENIIVKPLKVLDIINELKEVADDENGGQFGYRNTCLVVATLILTVTFTAGFTVPGGFSSAEGSSKGMAVLYNSKAFTAFVISNSLALILACFEVIDVIFNRDILGGKSLIMTLMEDRVGLIGVALPLMEIAFSTGLYVVLPETSTVGIYVVTIGSAFAFAAYVYGALALGLTYVKNYGLVGYETKLIPAFMVSFIRGRVNEFSHI